jgi:hypothetical protein
VPWRLGGGARERPLRLQGPSMGSRGERREQGAPAPAQPAGVRGEEAGERGPEEIHPALQLGSQGGGGQEGSFVFVLVQQIV